MMQKMPNGRVKLTLSDFFQLFVIGFIGLLIPTVVVYRHFLIVAPVKELTTIKHGMGILFIVVAALIMATNLHLAIIRPWWYRLKHGNFENYKNESGIPLIGEIFVVMAALYSPSSHITGALLLFVYFSNVSAIPWFFVQLVRHGL